MGPFLLVFYCSGEFYTNESVRPLEDGQLIGLAYTEINEPYKYEMTRKMGPIDVIALGSSRIMQVKKNIFRRDVTFYNAGGAVNNIYQYRLFLEKLPYCPKLFVINIDQWYFNPNYENQRFSLRKDCYDTPRQHIVKQCAALFKDIMAGKIDFRKLFDTDNRNIGIHARLNGSGFAADGSYYYGGIIRSPSTAKDYKFKDTFGRIEQGNQRFQYCDKADTTVTDAIDSFLSSCTEKGVAVIAILPPFAPSVYEKMNESGHYQYLRQIPESLSAVFGKYGNCFLYDYTDMGQMGVQDHDFIDGFHGSEVIYNYLMKDIAHKNAVLSQFLVDTCTLDTIIRHYHARNIHYHPIRRATYEGSSGKTLRHLYRERAQMAEEIAPSWGILPNILPFSLSVTKNVVFLHHNSDI
jgi:hypothetical protein